MSAQYRQPETTDLESVSTLIREAFWANVAFGWSPEACATFHDEVSPENLHRAFASSFFSEVCVVDSAIVGVVSLPSARVVSLTFVGAQYRRRGIGSTLIEHALRRVEAIEPEISIVSLNSSEHALPFYAAQGFFPVSPAFEFSGTVATRMAVWLPYYDSIGPKDESANPTVNWTRRFIPSFSSTARRRAGYPQR